MFYKVEPLYRVSTLRFASYIHTCTYNDLRSLSIIFYQHFISTQKTPSNKNEGIYKWIFEYQADFLCNINRRSASTQRKKRNKIKFQLQIHSIQKQKTIFSNHNNSRGLWNHRSNRHKYASLFELNVAFLLRSICGFIGLSRWVAVVVALHSLMEATSNPLQSNHSMQVHWVYRSM